MVTVAVPLIAEELSATGLPPLTEHDGALTTPAGEVARTQASDTDPAYPAVELTVIVELAEPPLETAAGAEAARPKADAVTVTGTLVPVAALK